MAPQKKAAPKKKIGLSRDDPIGNLTQSEYVEKMAKKGYKIPPPRILSTSKVKSSPAGSSSVAKPSPAKNKAPAKGKLVSYDWYTRKIKLNSFPFLRTMSLFRKVLLLQIVD